MMKIPKWIKFISWSLLTLAGIVVCLGGIIAGATLITHIANGLGLIGWCWAALGAALAATAIGYAWSRVYGGW